MVDIAHLDTNIFDTVAKFLRVMKNAGADFTGPMQDCDQRAQLIKFLTYGCPAFRVEEFARRTLGSDFISPEEMEMECALGYRDELVTQMSATFPSIELLELLGKDWVLIPGPMKNLTLKNVAHLDNGEFLLDSDSCWHRQERFFTEDIVRAGRWLILHKRGYPNSQEKGWEEQRKLVTNFERVPNVAEVAYALVMYARLRHKTFLHEGEYLRTSSIDSDGVRVTIGALIDYNARTSHNKDMRQHLHIWRCHRGDENSQSKLGLAVVKD